MSYSTRKEFLQTSALLLATVLAGDFVDLKKKKALLSFSTLGCPDWTFQQITDFAVQHGYKGIEVRGLQRQMDLTKCPEFSTEQSRKATMALMKKKGLQFINLGSSATLHFADGAEREKNLAEGRSFIDLAQQVNCPYIRVFPNKFPKDRDKNTTIGLIVKGLLELGDYAKEKNVSVLMETHGDVVKIADLEEIMRLAEHPNVGLVWDPSNMWTVTKEPPADAYKKLKKYTRHTHIKDAKLSGDKLDYKFLGKGDVPIFEAIDALAKGGYKGFYSFEWEKMWHPEIAEPELAIADYAKVMKQYFKRL
ncbi:MAG: sugar phosphate isomerase/epimerase family protein [Chitinophagaceae bacterium]